MSLIRVGRLYKTHGLKGEIKLYPESDDINDILALDTLYIGKSESRAIPYKVQSFRAQEAKGHLFLLVKFLEIKSIEEAEPLQNLQVYALQDAVPLAEDEYFIHDILGATALDPEGKVLGTVKDYVELPTYYAFVIERPDLPDALVPDVEAFVIEVNPEEQKVILNPIEGLL